MEPYGITIMLCTNSRCYAHIDKREAIFILFKQRHDFAREKYVAESKTVCEISDVLQHCFDVSQDVCILNLIHLQLFQSTGMEAMRVMNSASR